MINMVRPSTKQQLLDKKEALRILFPLSTPERVILEMVLEGFSRSEIERVTWDILESDTNFDIFTLSIYAFGKTKIKRPNERMFKRSQVKYFLEKLATKARNL